MRRHVTGDVWADAKLLQAEERIARAHAFAAWAALRRDTRSPRRGIRGWLGAGLLRLGHRLLRSAPGSA